MEEMEKKEEDNEKLVECFGIFFMGVCRLIGRVLSVACGMFRYVFYGGVSVAWEIDSKAQSRAE